MTTPAVTVAPVATIEQAARTRVLPRIPGVDPRRLAVAVRDGVVSISGRVEPRSAVSGLVRATLEVEGVIGVDQAIAFDVDDRYPIIPAGF